MSSYISTSGININFPISGLNNAGQGFRDNWAAIAQQLNNANAAITSVQANFGLMYDLIQTISGPTGPTGPAGVFPLDVSSSIVTAQNSTNARILSTRFSDIINILDFGADPSGTNNSIDAIMSAISSTSSYGGIVYFPPGKYKIFPSSNNTSGTISITKSNITLLGAGRGSTELNFQNTTADCIYVGYNSPTTNGYINAFKICDLTMTFANKSGGRAIYMGFVSNSIIDNLQIVSPYTGIDIYVTNTILINNITLTNPTAPNDTGYGLQWRGPTDGSVWPAGTPYAGNSVRSDNLTCRGVVINCGFNGNGVLWSGLANTFYWYDGAILETNIGFWVQAPSPEPVYNNYVPAFLESFAMGIENCKSMAMKIDRGQQFHIFDGVFSNMSAAPVGIISATCIGTTATIVFSNSANATVFPAGTKITVSGVSVSGYNGVDLIVTSSSAGQVSYTVASTLASGTGGYIYFKTLQGGADTNCVYIAADAPPQPGVTATTASYVNSIKFIGCRIGLSGQSAVYCAARSVQFIGCTFVSASLSSPYTYPAVWIDPPAQSIIINGCSDWEWGAFSVAKEAIYLAYASDPNYSVNGIIIQGNNFVLDYNGPIVNNETVGYAKISLNGVSYQNPSNFLFDYFTPSTLPSADSGTAGIILKASYLLGGTFVRSGPTADFSDTTDSAANIVQSLSEPNINGTVTLMLINHTAHTMTILPGAGVNFGGLASNTLPFTIPPQSTRMFNIVVGVLAAGAEEVTIYG